MKGRYKVQCCKCKELGWKHYNEPFVCKKCGVVNEFTVIYGKKKGGGKTPVGS